jgi:hypothetical protein
MLEFNTERRKSGSPATEGPVDPESLVARLAGAGCRVVEIDWERIGAIKLSVEDDVAFICEAYNELATVAVEGGRQHVYLGDGEVELVVTFSSGRSHIVQRFSPFLNRHLTRTCEYVVSTDQYAAAWHNLVRSIEGMVAS